MPGAAVARPSPVLLPPFPCMPNPASSLAWPCRGTRPSCSASWRRTAPPCPPSPAGLQLSTRLRSQTRTFSQSASPPLRLWRPAALQCYAAAPCVEPSRPPCRTEHTHRASAMPPQPPATHHHCLPQAARFKSNYRHCLLHQHNSNSSPTNIQQR